MPRSTKQDITGQRFGRLVALRFVPCAGKYAKFLFRCDCGTEKEILSQSVRAGATKSCGCAHSEGAKKRAKHNQSGRGRTPTYNSWAGMMDRCEWGGHPSYAYYGARGIRVCERWHDFTNFLADMGKRPPGTSIDRIDNNNGYEPANCRWATRQQQNLNTARTRRVKYQGKVITVYELCARLDISRKALRSRAARRGNDYVEALRSAGIDCEAVS